MGKYTNFYQISIYKRSHRCISWPICTTFLAITESFMLGHVLKSCQICKEFQSYCGLHLRGSGYLPNFQHPVVVKKHLMHNKLRLRFTWNGFSPVCTSWCRLSFELSTNDLPHSAQMCTRGPCVWRCLRIAALSRNNLLQPCNISNTLLARDTPYPPITAIFHLYFG